MPNPSAFSPASPAPSSAWEALAMVESAWDFLNGDDVAGLPVATLAECLRKWQRLEAKQTAAAIRLAEAFDAADGPAADGQRSQVSWLTLFGRITKAAARAWVSRVRRLRGQRVVRAALADGSITVSVGEWIADVVGKFPTDDRGQVEQILVEAAVGGALMEDLAELAARMFRLLVPDGPEKQEQRQDDDRRLTLGRTLDGVGRLNADLNRRATALAEQVINALAVKSGPEDLRTAPQRRHDALAEAFQRLIDSDLLPQRGGVKPHLRVDIPLVILRKMHGSPDAEARWVREKAADLARSRMAARTATGPAPSEGAQSERPPSERPPFRGVASEGAAREGAAQAGCTQAGCSQAGAAFTLEGSASCGAACRGAESDGIESDRAESDGAESDGAESDGAESDGAESDGADAVRAGSAARASAGSADRGAADGGMPGVQPPDAGPPDAGPFAAGLSATGPPGAEAYDGEAYGGESAVEIAGQGAVLSGIGPVSDRLADALACDSVLSPTVTGRVDRRALDAMTDHWLSTHALVGRGSCPEGDGCRCDCHHPVSADTHERTRRTLLRWAIEVLSGPDGLASYMRSGTPDRDLNARSIVLDVGADTRTVPAPLERAVRSRDRGCRFPGCDHPAELSQVHHMVPRAHRGPTRLDNLITMCGFHHLIAVHSWGWSIRLNPDGTATATSPEGVDLPENPPPDVQPPLWAA